jgi:S1-C subfamily serine protease
MAVTPDSKAAAFLQINDVILSFDNKPVNDWHDLLEARKSVVGAKAGVVIFRNQHEIKEWVELNK